MLGRCDFRANRVVPSAMASTSMSYDARRLGLACQSMDDFFVGVGCNFVGFLATVVRQAVASLYEAKGRYEEEKGWRGKSEFNLPFGARK